MRGWLGTVKFSFVLGSQHHQTNQFGYPKGWLQTDTRPDYPQMVQISLFSERCINSVQIPKTDGDLRDKPPHHLLGMSFANLRVLIAKKQRTVWTQFPCFRRFDSFKSTDMTPKTSPKRRKMARVSGTAHPFSRNPVVRETRARPLYVT